MERSYWKNRVVFDAARDEAVRNARRLLHFTAKQSGISERDIVASCRKRKLAMVRMAYVWAARRGIFVRPLIELHHYTAYRASKMRQKPRPVTYPQLGGLLGGRDHTSIMHLDRQAEIWRARDAEFAGLCLTLLNGCRTGEALLPSYLEKQQVGRPIKINVLSLGESAKRKPKNDISPDDRDAFKRLRGTQALLAAIAREHPERMLRAAA